MSTKEQLAVVYSKEGWIQLAEKIGSHLLSTHERRIVLEIINGADLHKIGPQRDHMLVFDQIDVGDSDTSILLHTIHDNMDSDYYYVYILFDDGSEDSFGLFDSNSFNVRVRRELVWTGGLDVKDILSIPDPAPQKPKTKALVNNYTCPTCQNDKCSVTEDKCWRCGNPL